MKKLITLLTVMALSTALLAGCSNSNTAPVSSAASQAGAASTTSSQTASGSSSSAASATTSQAAESSSAAPATSSTQAATSSSASSSAAASSKSYSKDALKKTLNACLTYEADSAGGSLKSAAAAAGLVSFSVKNDTKANKNAMNADVKSWYNSLRKDQKNTLRSNWAEIKEDVQSIVKNPSTVKGMLSDAGITTNFSAMDLTNGSTLCNQLNSLIKTK